MIDHEQNRRILIIDDNESIHNDFAKILTQKQMSQELSSLEDDLFGDAATPKDASDLAPQTFELSFAQQGPQGLELVRQALGQAQPFAMAFVDMRMPPGWDGLEGV